MKASHHSSNRCVSLLKQHYYYIHISAYLYMYNGISSNYYTYITAIHQLLWLQLYCYCMHSSYQIYVNDCFGTITTLAGWYFSYQSLIIVLFYLSPLQVHLLLEIIIIIIITSDVNHCIGAWSCQPLKIFQEEKSTQRLTDNEIGHDLPFQSIDCRRYILECYF